MLKKTVSLIALMATLSISATTLNTSAIAQDMAKKIDVTNDYWWPNRLNLQPLRLHSAKSDPIGKGFDYGKEFATLDLDVMKKELQKLMVTSQDWWPADYGHYGPFFIRMAWHSAGTYRTFDGRGGAGGGMQRFAPLNSWPDNVNLDKARRLLWPIKQKYGKKISWGDLMVLAGTVAMEDMGFKTLGFAGGRIDQWEPEEVYWGPEGEWLGSNRHDQDRMLRKPLAATRMGLIYVNPEGPNGYPDPLLAAKDIRATFGGMAMNDEETVALIAGGHTFGKAHGAHDAAECLDEAPEYTGIEEQGLGWKNKCGAGNGVDTVSSGLEGAWTSAPAQWTHMYLSNLFIFNWVQTKSPAGAIQWIPDNENAKGLVPDAHDPNKFHAPIMFTTDLALKFDPEYRKISQRFLDNPEEFDKAFARAWFKLTHRDLGPRARYVGSLVPPQELIWQDPVPAVDHKLVNAKDIKKLKSKILKSGLSVSQLVKTAWESAATFRGTDMRGGANGARIRLVPQKDWQANDPADLAKALKALGKVQKSFNKSARKGQKISMADLIVLGGATAIEKAAKDAGYSVTVPFKPGRTDASQKQTDVKSFAFLKPKADGFRNYFAKGNVRSPAEMLVEKAAMLNLSIPEMTVLIGGMRVLDANAGHAKHGVFTDKPGSLTNDFFVNLLDMSTEWKKSTQSNSIYEGYERTSGKVKWTATPVDLIFGSNTELRAVAEVYAFEGAEKKFAEDFVAAWTKVMNLDRF